jgi:hypothetical protein
MTLEPTDSGGAVAAHPYPGARVLPGSSRLQRARRALEHLEETSAGPAVGYLALAVLALAVMAVVFFAASGTSILVPRSAAIFPGWEVGPLKLLVEHIKLPQVQTRILYSELLIALVGAYALALLAARSLPMRVVVAFAVGVNLILLLGPPLQLNDVFNYLGYARLGGLHGLNPYRDVMRQESHDPIFTFTTWQNYTSPYGPLFTALTYPLALLSIPVAYWVVKSAVVAASLAMLAIIVWCARRLGRDPRFALLFVVANPAYLFFAVGGFHNDFLMLVPSMGAIAFLLARRDRAAGAALIIAVAIKPTAIVLLPFLLIAAKPSERRLRILQGCLIAAIPMIALWLALFGTALPNIAGQSALVTGYSIPNLLGLLLGQGGATVDVQRLCDVGVMLVVLWGLRRRDWIAWSGWATLALIASIAWLMPWYVVWALPLAALGGSRSLRFACVAFTLYLVIAFVPETNLLAGHLGLHPMGSPVDQAALRMQLRLQGLT